MTEVRVEPITPGLGAKVHIAAGEVTDEGIPGQILAALNSYNVLVFPQLHLDDDQLVALSGALGEKEEVRASADGSAPGDKGVYRISLDKDDKTQLEYVRGNDFWHMDGTSYRVPGKATFLQELVEWCTQGRFTCRHHWQKGDLVIFNNPALLHRSYPYDIAAGSVMHRTTLKGREAIA